MNKENELQLYLVNNSKRTDKLNQLLELMWTAWEDDALTAKEFAEKDNIQTLITDDLLTDDLDNDAVRLFLTVALENAVDWDALNKFFKGGS